MSRLATATRPADHRKCGACLTDQASGLPGVLCHAGHFHANAYSATRCTSRPTHRVAPADDLWETTRWADSPR